MTRVTSRGPGEFYGTSEYLYRGSGLTVCESGYGPGSRTPTHAHEHAFFSLLIEGGYSDQYVRRRVEYRPFTLVFHPPAERHACEMGPQGGRVVNIELAPEWLERLGEVARVPGTTPVLNAGDLVWLATRLHRECRCADDCSPLAIEGLALEMLAALPRSSVGRSRRPPRWLNDARDMLHAGFRQRLTVRDIASHVGVHPVHLSRVFREFHRHGIGDYLRGLRVEFACRQLLDPALEIAEVGLDAGFADQSHFTRAFRRVTGMTPGEFRAHTAAGA